MTFEQAADEFRRWAVESQIKPTPRSQKYWRRHFEALETHVIPALGKFPMSEIPGCLLHSCELLVRDSRPDYSDPERLTALKAAQRVLEYFLTGR